MTNRVLARVREVLGGVAVAPDPDGRPRVAPESTDDVARTLSLAHQEGWKVRVEGRATWCPPDAPADLVLTTAALDTVVSVAAPDLVATVGAGAPLGAVQRRLAAERVWLAWDPPGRPQRSLGSIVATATAGPLRHRFGPVRDHVLGCTFVSGDGRIISPGGSVVKNVAGYDLTRLMVGGFGAFGVVTQLHLRLRATPEADLTVMTRGGRDDLTAIGRELTEASIDAAAMELLSPATAAEPEWVLAIRLAGAARGVRAESARIRQVAHQAAWTQLATEQANALWHGAAHAAMAGNTTFRLGVLLDGLDDTLDLLADHLDIGLVAAGAGSGSIRWTGDAPPDRLLVVRRLTAAREIPMTIERAPWDIRQATGHFGPYREGVGALVSRLRDTFDPGRVLVVPLDTDG